MSVSLPTPLEGGLPSQTTREPLSQAGCSGSRCRAGVRGPDVCEGSTLRRAGGGGTGLRKWLQGLQACKASPIPEGAPEQLPPTEHPALGCGGWTSRVTSRSL